MNSSAFNGLSVNLTLKIFFPGSSLEQAIDITFINKSEEGRKAILFMIRKLLMLIVKIVPKDAFIENKPPPDLPPLGEATHAQRPMIESYE